MFCEQKCYRRISTGGNDEEMGKEERFQREDNSMCERYGILIDMNINLQGLRPGETGHIGKKGSLINDVEWIIII